MRRLNKSSFFLRGKLYDWERDGCNVGDEATASRDMVEVSLVEKQLNDVQPSCSERKALITTLAELSG